MIPQQKAAGSERSIVVHRASTRTSPGDASCVRRRSDAALALGIALLFFGVAMFFWSGDFHSSDGLSMYTAADSLARYGRFDIEQIRWMDLQQGTYGPDDLLYSRKGLGTTILIFPFALLGILLPGIGPVHAALLLTPVATALSGLLLYVAGRRAFPSLPQSALVLAALAWGVGSMALPYSKTLFSDPLVALMMIGAFERLLAFRDADTEGELLCRGAGVGVWLALGLLTRAAHGIVLPIFGLALLWILGRYVLPQDARRKTLPAHFISAAWRPIIAFITPIALAGLLALWYNWIRFGAPFNSGYLPQESFSAIWWRGIVGQLVSPGRGLLWYTPWLLLVVPAVLWAWRRAPVGTAVAGGSFLAYLLLYGKWYMWHGGFAWGPRFLVPVLPLLAWVAVPAVARSRWLFVGLAALGVGVNLIGALWSFAPHQQWLEAQLPLFDPRTFFDVYYAQIPGVLRLGLSQPLDVVWMSDGRLQSSVGWAISVVILGSIGAYVAWRPGSGEQGSSAAGEREGVGRAFVLVVGLVLVATWGLLKQARAEQPAAYHDIASALADQSASRTMIWHDDLEYTSVFLNTYTERALIVGANVVGETPSEHLGERLPALAASPRSVWVVSDGPAPAANALDRAAMQHKGLVEEHTFGERLRATHYFDTGDWESQPMNITFVNDGQTIIKVLGAAIATQDSIAAIRIHWQAVAPVAENYQIFVHLVDATGERVAQDDGPAQNGLAPTSTWQPGETIEDVHALKMPAAAPQGKYTFVVGLYRLEDLRRLTTLDGRDTVHIGPVAVP